MTQQKSQMTFDSFTLLVGRSLLNCEYWQRPKLSSYYANYYAKGISFTFGYNTVTRKWELSYLDKDYEDIPDLLTVVSLISQVQSVEGEYSNV